MTEKGGRHILNVLYDVNFSVFLKWLTLPIIASTVAISDARLYHLKQFKNRFDPQKELTEEMHIRIDTQLPIKVVRK